MAQEMKMQSVVILCRNNFILISIFTPKEWFLSKKGPKEGERVAQGHFHERDRDDTGHEKHDPEEEHLPVAMEAVQSSDQE